MIRFEHVSKAYLGGRQALQGVTFHLQPGEMAFLTGHSGAGKSTLLNLIWGLSGQAPGRFCSAATISAACKTVRCRSAPPDRHDFPGSPSADGPYRV
ncbi:ATP-binding cassette domain-containing protein [Escherichia coli]